MYGSPAEKGRDMMLLITWFVGRGVTADPLLVEVQHR